MKPPSPMVNSFSGLFLVRQHLLKHLGKIKLKISQALVARTFNPKNWEAEGDGYLSWRPAWSTEFQASQGYKETLSWTKQNKTKNRKIFAFNKALEVSEWGGSITQALLFPSPLTTAGVFEWFRVRYKYTYMEEMLGNVAGARQVFERWMEWQPEEQAWHSYINFELRYKEVERARTIYERYILWMRDYWYMAVMGVYLPKRCHSKDVAVNVTLRARKASFVAFTISYRVRN